MVKFEFVDSLILHTRNDKATWGSLMQARMQGTITRTKKATMRADTLHVFVTSCNYYVLLPHHGEYWLFDIYKAGAPNESFRREDVPKALVILKTPNK